MTIRQILDRFANNGNVFLNVVQKSRDEIIRDKIAERYSLADEIALINNYNLYLQDNSLIQYKEEYDEYINYRLQIKENLS